MFWKFRDASQLQYIIGLREETIEPRGNQTPGEQVNSTDTEWRQDLNPQPQRNKENMLNTKPSYTMKERKKQTKQVAKVTSKQTETRTSR